VKTSDWPVVSFVRIGPATGPYSRARHEGRAFPATVTIDDPADVDGWKTNPAVSVTVAPAVSVKTNPVTSTTSAARVNCWIVVSSHRPRGATNASCTAR